MGLAGPKKKTKIFNDPNNTSWTRSTSNYGHKIMTAQGWAPGEYLGVADNNRADTYTAASSSHIRVSLKDDTLGLGAKPRRPLIDDEPTGLDAFQGLLGRLNGRSEVEIEKELKVKSDIKALTYIERRWGCMNFIGGGLLVPDKVNKIPNGEEDKESEDSEEVKPITESAGEDIDRKERKKREKKEKRERKEKKEKSKERKKRKKGSEESGDIADSGFATEPSASASRAETPVDADSTDSKSDKQRSKDKKKSKKRKRKEELQASKAGSSATSDDEDAKSIKEDDTTSHTVAPIAVKERVIPFARQLLRGRYIQQKRRAVMDSKSLNEGSSLATSDAMDVCLSRIQAGLSGMTLADTSQLASMLDFEVSLAEKLRGGGTGPYIVDSEGMIRVPAVLFAGDPTKGIPGITLTPTAPNTPVTPAATPAISAFSPLPPPPPTPPGFEFKNNTERYFFAIAARAFQEAVKVPEKPPPFGWLPGQKCLVYYSTVLEQFTICFREHLRRKGRYHEATFNEESQRHHISIFSNVRSRWHYTPFGSIDGFKTTVQTPNSDVAVRALKYTVRKPLSPPPDGWQFNEPLHTYYDIMLARFRIHLRTLLQDHPTIMVDEPLDLYDAIRKFTELIIHEYRRVWIANYGL
ncbi:uncharacterized protein GIQ15_04497 [Arthroderma uncinatum]|uniref:uncharacterized protein n=1 Tax=Arthroderma uncinatum TaxID=74035 RepID=UPI00144A7E1C|nr:uncharacterized protein GIQ15_04497 [Arthroderma uncinatum]KAF3481738.1 hypothetical protein GIQ15_04497 [Arthroderma uncinatum]